MSRLALASSTRTLAGSFPRLALRRLPPGPANLLFPAAALSRHVSLVAAVARPRLDTSRGAATRRWLSGRPDQDEKRPEVVLEDSAALDAEEDALADEDPDDPEYVDDNTPDAMEPVHTEVAKWKDLATRRLADYYNLQEQSRRVQKMARDFAIQPFAQDLLETLDNFDRVLETSSPAAAPPPAAGTGPEQSADEPQQPEVASANGASSDAVTWLEGLRLTESALMRTLQKHGLTRLDPVGQKFDPNEHEAIFMVRQPDKEHNTVFLVQQKGYKLNGRVIRAAKVGVIKNSS